MQVTLLFQGAKKGQKRGPPGLKQLKQPVTFELLSRIVDASSVCATSKYEEKLLKASFTVAFYGLFRVGEITFTKNPSTVILCEEVKDNQDYMVLKLHSAKTACPNETQLVELVKTHDKTSPVVNLKTYLAASNTSFGPLFQLLGGGGQSFWLIL